MTRGFIHLRFCLLVLATSASSSCRAVREISESQPLSVHTGVVRGTVVNESSGAAIVGATLVLGARADSLGGSEPQTFSYPPDGSFRFTGVLPGAYVIRVAAEGYVSTTAGVRLGAPNEIVSVRLALSTK